MQNKRIVNILFIALIICESKVQFNLGKENEYTNLYEALNTIIQQTFIENESQLLFYTYLKNNSAQQRNYANDFINGVLHGISNCSYQVFFQKKKTFMNLKQDEVILLDNIKAFPRFFRKLRNIGNMDLARTIIFIASLTTLDYETMYLIFKDLYHMDMIRVALVIKLSHNDIVMLTYFPFTSESCQDFKPVIINRYLVDERRWENYDYFPEKLDDFYGCPVVCCTWEDMPYFIVQPNEKNSSLIDYVGLEAELLKFAATSLNFSIKIYWIDPITAVHNQDSFFAEIFSQHCEFALGGFSYRNDLDSASTFSQTNYFLFSHIYIVTNAIHFYTTYEKLAFPFKYSVWFAIGLIFALSSLVICTCGRRRQWLGYRNFLIGTTNKTPQYYLYTLAVGANMTTAHMPKRNFARFLLISWLLMTFILRIAYQSGMYQMLRENKKWNPPQTIESVFKQKYLISMTPENRKYLSILPDAKRERIFSTTILESFWELLNAKEAIAFVTPFEYFGYFGKMYGSQWQHLHLVNERLLTQQLTIYLRHHSYFVALFNDLFSHAQYHGFMTMWSSKYSLSVETALKQSAGVQTNSSSDINPLSLNELGAIFMIIVWLHVAAIAVFLVEIMWHRCGSFVKCYFKLRI